MSTMTEYFKTSGLTVDILGDTRDLGSTSNLAYKNTTTDKIGEAVIATNTEQKSIWDTVGEVADAVNAADLLNRYIGVQITKKAVKDGVPLYTTYGNPSDQAGGQLLQGVAVAQEKSAKNYYLIGGGIFAAVVIVYLLAGRK